MISSMPLFNNQRFQNAAIHMEIAQHANYPFARQTTKGLIQSTDKFAHSKNATCSSQNRRWLRRRTDVSAMAICYSQSDRFKRRSSRTMTYDRQMQKLDEDMAKRKYADFIENTGWSHSRNASHARRARVGGLCRFRSPAERVPAGSLKIGRCAGVRECWRKMLILARTAVGKAACDKRGNTPKRAKSRDFARCGEKAGQNRGVVRAPRRSHLPAVRAVSGIYEGVPNTAKNSRRALRNEKSPPFQGKQRGSNKKHEVNTEKW